LTAIISLTIEYQKMPQLPVKWDSQNRLEQEMAS